MGKKSGKVYVVGHKNPDTDSICSAIAYAHLKKEITGEEYVPRRAGLINEETAYVLQRFGVDAPPLLQNVKLQVKDIDIHKIDGVDPQMSIKDTWQKMKENNIKTIPVLKDEELVGVISTGDIATSYMDVYDNRVLSAAKTQYRNIIKTLDGTLVTGNEHGHFTKGKVAIGASTPDLMEQFIEKDDLVILGNRYESQACAVDIDASCLVVCQNAEVPDELIKKAEEQSIVIIRTPHDTFTVARLINQSIPVSFVMKRDNMVTFNTEDFTDDIQDVMIKNRHRAFPVINPHGKCIGTISRRNFLDMHKKKVVLVDHNEVDQAVDNIEKAEILEIIDHHKLGTLQTMTPVAFRNEPVGCTGTILYEIYGEQRLEIPEKIAGLLCAAIISDTLMFRSPTCTQTDKIAASALALIAGIKIEEFAREMFSAGSNLKDKSPEEIFYQDYKKFIGEGNVSFGVGQISSMDSEELKEIKEKLMPFMVSECGRHDITRVYFMLTNILEESTELLFYGEGSQQMAEIAFERKPDGDTFSLPGVVSRKKQLIPAMMEAAQLMNSDYA